MRSPLPHNVAVTEQQDPRRWIVLAVGLLGLTAGCAAQYGLAFLIPALRAEGHCLETATLLVTAPIAGILCTLIAWGAAADRWGERRILALGLAVAGIAELGAASVDEPIQRWLLLFVVGASSASIHAASGRLILGWFGASERGLAMGIRQMGQPLGVGFAAIVLPPLAVSGVGNALAALGVACLASAALIWLVVRDPIRATDTTGSSSVSPYREPFLWRIHAASGLLVIPQFAVVVFAFDYLVHALGWSITDAGALLASTQLAGAALAAGRRLVVGPGGIAPGTDAPRGADDRDLDGRPGDPRLDRRLGRRGSPGSCRGRDGDLEWPRIHRGRGASRPAMGRSRARESRTRSRT